eukprot:CAMPEP_0174720040 /NCGR_PEP_ID=MMETSP1094-20130205/32648_1 /TAXON_ID=156173 /ORGANISM="Chrysochromulina brevifilum, Strain UTEX LB 985" /LENGTH=86 /DNA_ID=CAMNT_0015920465 /DNA_START=105 /DNA_END=361 /DNA_ORIENTATION=+
MPACTSFKFNDIGLYRQGSPCAQHSACACRMSWVQCARIYDACAFERRILNKVSRSERCVARAGGGGGGGDGGGGIEYKWQRASPP